jgi:hypothetical protein
VIKEWIQDVDDDIELKGNLSAVKYFEVSAFDNTNIKTLIHWAANEGFKRYSQVENKRFA